MSSQACTGGAFCLKKSHGFPCPVWHTLSHVSPSCKACQPACPTRPSAHSLALRTREAVRSHCTILCTAGALPVPGMRARRRPVLSLYHACLVEVPIDLTRVVNSRFLHCDHAVDSATACYGPACMISPTGENLLQSEAYDSLGPAAHNRPTFCTLQGSSGECRDSGCKSCS